MSQVVSKPVELFKDTWKTTLKAASFNTFEFKGDKPKAKKNKGPGELDFDPLSQQDINAATILGGIAASRASKLGQPGRKQTVLSSTVQKSSILG